MYTIIHSHLDYNLNQVGCHIIVSFRQSVLRSIHYFDIICTNVTTTQQSSCCSVTSVTIRFINFYILCKLQDLRLKSILVLKISYVLKIV